MAEPIFDQAEIMHFMNNQKQMDAVSGSRIEQKLNSLLLEKREEVKRVEQIDKLTKIFNEEYTKYRGTLDRNVKEYSNITEEGSPYKTEDLDERIAGWAGFESVPRTSGVAGMFIVPPSKISFSQMYNATLDSVIGTQLQYLRAYILSRFRDYTHPDKKFEKMVKKMMYSISWNTKFLFGLSMYLYSGSSCAQVIWSYDKKDKTVYPSDLVFAPSTNIQYMANYQGSMIAAVQPNIFADPQGLFNPKNTSDGESEFALREYIGQQLPYIMMPREDLFYCAFDNVTSPYGLSLVRRAYPYFQNKQILNNMLMHASAKNSAPFMVATYDKNAFKDSTQIDEARNALASLTVGDTATIPEGIDVQALDVNKGSIESLLQAIKYQDAMMVRAMLGGGANSSSTGESNDSYASKNEDNESLERALDLHYFTVKDAIEECLLLPLARHNDVKSVYEDLEFGTWIGSETTLSQKMQLAKIHESGVNSGLINPANMEQTNYFLGKLNIPLSTEEDLASREDLNGKSETNTRDTGESYSHQDTGAKEIYDN